MKIGVGWGVRRGDEDGVLARAQSAYHVHSGRQPFSWKSSLASLAEVQRACNVPPAVSTGSSIQMIRFASLSPGRCVSSSPVIDENLGVPARL